MVDNLLSGGLSSIRSSILARFCKFYKILTMSKSLAVRVMANISAMDIRSVTGSNLFNIRKEIKLDPARDPVPCLKKQILGLEVNVPVQDT